MFRKLTKKFFIITNALVALAYLIGVFGGSAGAGGWFTGIMTLAAPYLAIVLFVFIIFWLFTRPTWLIISALCFALTWQPLKNIFALRLSPEFVMQKNPANLRVMTWNVEHFRIAENKSHPEYKQKMLALIKAYNPDVACFQEMVGSDFQPNAINYIPDLMAALQMPYYFYSYNPKLDFDKDHHFGVLIFSKLPIVSKHTISYEPYDYNSIFQYVDLVRNTDTFRVFNVHLQSLRFSQENMDYINDPASKKALSESRNLLSKLKHGFEKREIQSDHIKGDISKSPYPVVVCGDFNDVPNSYAYKTIGANLKNTWAVKGSGIGRTFNSIAPTLRIDNIFTDPRILTEQVTTHRNSISDHNPVIADLFFENIK